MFTQCILDYKSYISTLQLDSVALHWFGRRPFYLSGIICGDQIITSNSPHHLHRLV